METVDVLFPSAADASVRPARAGDLPAIGGIHARAWTSSYRELLPAHLLPGITAEAMTDAWRPHLQESGQRFHHLLVACTGPTVVGFAAFGRAPEQPGAGPADGDLSTLLVDATHQRSGHGSRLLSAGVDALREDGATRLFCWVPAVDGPRISFLESAGLRQDGAWRQLSAGGAAEDDLREVRLVALLGSDE